MTDGQTDGRTDGIAVASTALAMRALRRAVKTVSGKVVAQSVAFPVAAGSSVPLISERDQPPLEARGGALRCPVSECWPSC